VIFKEIQADTLLVHSTPADPLGQAAEASSGSGNIIMDVLLSKVPDHIYAYVDLEPFGIPFRLPLSKHLLFFTLAGILVTILAVIAAQQNTKNRVPKGLGNLFEVFIVFIRDEIVVPNMGKAGVAYMPFLLTVFFLILFSNLFGLLPLAGLSTSNLMITAGLASISFVMIQVAAIRSQGIVHYLAHLTGGVPWFLWPIMIPVELLGLFTKPFALAMRLFANMFGGKIVVSSFLGLILFFGSWIIMPGPMLFSVGVNMLELFVSFLQAYVFTLLTALFMGFGMQSDHSSEEHAH